MAIVFGASRVLMAAANLAEQLFVRLESSVVETSNERGTRTDERIRSERLYNEETGTAFLLSEMAID